jgi:hypothetical protein
MLHDIFEIRPSRNLTPYAVSKLMTKAEKLLARMRQNPAGDWTIQDVECLCSGLGSGVRRLYGRPLTLESCGGR